MREKKKRNLRNLAEFNSGNPLNMTTHIGARQVEQNNTKDS